jgi:hypothetical protein
MAEPATPEQPAEAPTPPEAPAPETEAPAPETEAPAPETEAPAPAPEAPEVPDPEPGSPRRKRPREPASPPGLTIPRLDASFWQQLINESRATREASRRERFQNLLRF